MRLHGRGAGKRPLRGLVKRSTGIALAVIVVLWIAMPLLLSGYWLQVSTSAAIYSVVALGLNLLMGRVGLISLGQVALLGAGSWIALRLGYAFALPFPLTLLITGLLTAVLGVLVGLPALRLSGIYLALITLMAAAAITLVLQLINFPNGGTDILGFNQADSTSARLARPEIATSTADYFRYAVIVVGILFLVATLHVRGRPGRAWAAIRQSESAAIATGINVTLYKLWAFALAAFMTGVAGALLAASAGGVTIYQFPVQGSIQLVAAVLISGLFSLWGPLIAAAFTQVFPAILNGWGVPAEILFLLFGVGVIQVLLTAPGGVADQFPKDMRKLGRSLARLGRRKPREVEAR
jgi:branched-chain amino acid transport system permease protein